MASGSKLADLIRDVPDFPKKGILFKDITPLLLDPAALRGAVEALSSAAAGAAPALVAGIESRGFIFGSAVATRLGAGFVPVRKPGKLPARTASETYQLEYGTDTLEIHEDAIRPGDDVLLVDDLLATGGTAAAAVRLIRRLGGRIVGVAFLIELEFLGGRARLEGLPVTSLIRYS